MVYISLSMTRVITSWLRAWCDFNAKLALRCCHESSKTSKMIWEESTKVSIMHSKLFWWGVTKSQSRKITISHNCSPASEENISLWKFWSVTSIVVVSLSAASDSQCSPLLRWVLPSTQLISANQFAAKRMYMYTLYVHRDEVHEHPHFAYDGNARIRATYCTWSRINNSRIKFMNYDERSTVVSTTNARAWCSLTRASLRRLCFICTYNNNKNHCNFIRRRVSMRHTWYMRHPMYCKFYWQLACMLNGGFHRNSMPIFSA